MTRLRIGVEQLGAEGFHLELQGRDGARNLLVLAPGGGIRGRYEQDDETIGLRELRADTLVISELSWGLPHGRVQGSARMYDVQVDAVLATGTGRASRPAFVGSIRAARVEATVDLTLGDTKVHAAMLRLEGLELSADAEGRTHVALASAQASTVEGVQGPMQFRVDGLTLAEGIELAQGVLRLEHVHCETLTLDLASFEAETPASEASAAAAPRAAREPIDLAILDLLHGRLGVAVRTDVTLPIIGSRKATHTVDLPVDEGFVDYRRLEKSLATLESLVLDFELKADRLILEKDIPLLPFDNQPLVEWPLDPEGHALAKQHHRIRLSVLARPQLPPKARTAVDEERRSKGKAVQLRKLELDDIDIELAVAGAFAVPLAGGRLRFGHAGQAAIGQVRITGKVSHVPNAPSPGEVAVTGRDVSVSADSVRVGTRTLHVPSGHLRSIEQVTVGFAGFAPRALSSRLSDLRLAKVELRPSLGGPEQVG